MKYVMSDLLKEDIWKNFYKLSQIPRPSGYMQEVADFIENFGKNLGLETLRDKANNIIIKKPATLGKSKANRPYNFICFHLNHSIKYFFL